MEEMSWIREAGEEEMCWIKEEVQEEVEEEGRGRRGGKIEIG